MPSGLARRVELAANVAIIAVAALICFVLVKSYILGGSQGPPPQQQQQQRPKPVIGSKAAVPDVDWGRNGRTLVLVLQKGCGYCTDSAPFYQRLAREAGSVRLVAALPNKVEEGRQYLSELAVPVEEVRQASPQALGAPGTPTLLLVDGSGVVTDSWVGRLPPDKEDEVLSRLKS